MRGAAGRRRGGGDRPALGPGAAGPAGAAAPAPACRARWRCWACGCTPELAAHNVLFPPDYAAEFADLRAGRHPADPTLYLHASVKADPGDAPAGHENWFVMANAPALPQHDDRGAPGLWAAPPTRRGSGPTPRRRTGCARRWPPRLRRRRSDVVERDLGPADLARFGDRGAIYGAAPDGLLATLRPGPSLPGVANLWLAGGTVHPGGGIPLALLSGRYAAAALQRAASRGDPTPAGAPKEARRRPRRGRRRAAAPTPRHRTAAAARRRGAAALAAPSAPGRAGALQAAAGRHRDDGDARRTRAMAWRTAVTWASGSETTSASGRGERRPGGPPVRPLHPDAGEGAAEAVGQAGVELDQDEVVRRRRPPQRRGDRSRRRRPARRRPRRAAGRAARRSTPARPHPRGSAARGRSWGEPTAGLGTRWRAPPPRRPVHGAMLGP
jgi:hypothetical protein